jgi:hypothetical protein
VGRAIWNGLQLFREPGARVLGTSRSSNQDKCSLCWYPSAAEIRTECADLIIKLIVLFVTIAVSIPTVLSAYSFSVLQARRLCLV